MNQPSLDELLAKWNGGVLRGAARALSQKVKVEEATVSRWRSGDFPPDPELRPRIARELGVTIPNLMVAIARNKEIKRSMAFEVREPSTMLAQQTGYSFLDVPHLGTVSASRFMFSFDLPPENFTTLAIKGKAGERYAVLKIRGDCMAPKIEDGDEVLIRQTDDVADGTIAIVSFDGECTMKRVYRKKDGFELRADNRAYKPVHYTSSKVRIMAEVIKIMKDPGRKP